TAGSAWSTFPLALTYSSFTRVMVTRSFRVPLLQPASTMATDSSLSTSISVKLFTSSCCARYCSIRLSALPVATYDAPPCLGSASMALSLASMPFQTRVASAVVTHPLPCEGTPCPTGTGAPDGDTAEFEPHAATPHVAITNGMIRTIDRGAIRMAAIVRCGGDRGTVADRLPWPHANAGCAPP